MSNDTRIGQPQEYGLNDFKDTRGFLDGARVQYSDLRYDKHVWPAKGENPERSVIVCKATVITAKNQKSVTLEYQTNINWDDKFAVSEDGRNLVPKVQGARLPKGTEFFHLLNSFVNSGYIAQSEATTNLTKYIGADVVLASETVPGSKSTMQRPYPAEVAGEHTASVAAAPQETAPASTPTLDPDILAAANAALSSIVAQRGKISRDELAKELGNYAAANSWSSITRSTVLMSLYNMDTLKFVAEGLGFKVEGTTVSQS
jgi:hypothetical protein